MQKQIEAHSKTTQKWILREAGCNGTGWIQLVHDWCSGWFLCTKQYVSHSPWLTITGMTMQQNGLQQITRKISLTTQVKWNQIKNNAEWIAQKEAIKTWHFLMCWISTTSSPKALYHRINNKRTDVSLVLIFTGTSLFIQYKNTWIKDGKEYTSKTKHGVLLEANKILRAMPWK